MFRTERSLLWKVCAVSDVRPALRPPLGVRVPGQMTYEYRIFIVHDGEESTFSHFSSERLWEGAVLRVNKPGAEFDGLSVTVHRVVSHPTGHGPGIAYGRAADPGSD